jgi:hypothetical protein
VAYFCEHGDEPSGSIKKVGYFLISWVIISCSAPWSKVSRFANRESQHYISSAFNFRSHGQNLWLPHKLGERLRYLNPCS